MRPKKWDFSIFKLRKMCRPYYYRISIGIFLIIVSLNNKNIVESTPISTPEMNSSLIPSNEDDTMTVTDQIQHGIREYLTIHTMRSLVMKPLGRSGVYQFLTNFMNLVYRIYNSETNITRINDLFTTFRTLLNSDGAVAVDRASNTVTNFFGIYAAIVTGIEHAIARHKDRKKKKEEKFAESSLTFDETNERYEEEHQDSDGDFTMLCQSEEDDDGSNKIMFCQQSESNSNKVDHQDDEDNEDRAKDNNEILLENQVNKKLMVQNDLTMNDATNNEELENHLTYYYNTPYL